MLQAVPARSRSTASGARARVVVRTALRSPTHSYENRRLAKDLVWGWVSEKWPRLIPCASALEQTHIECALPGRKLSVATSEDGSAWTLEVSYTERDGACTWTTRAVVADSGVADVVALQTTCADLPATRLVAPPRVLGTWVRRLELEDAGVAVQGEPRMVESGDQLAAFCEQLLADRTLPVIALANKPNSRYYGVDPRGLAEAVRGLAHVACLTPEAVAAVADRFGRRLAPAQGAVRIYMPGFAATAGPQDHPLIRPPGTSRPGSVGEPGPDPSAFRRFLCQRICELSVATTMVDDAFLTPAIDGTASATSAELLHATAA